MLWIRCLHLESTDLSIDDGFSKMYICSNHWAFLSCPWLHANRGGSSTHSSFSYLLRSLSILTRLKTISFLHDTHFSFDLTPIYCEHRNILSRKNSGSSFQEDRKRWKSYSMFIHIRNKWKPMLQHLFRDWYQCQKCRLLNIFIRTPNLQWISLQLLSNTFHSSNH